MRNFLISVLLLIAAANILFYACKRDRTLRGNKSPIANAGLDQAVLTPTNSVLLDGTPSVDDDGTITEWLWTKVSGPASFQIENPNLVKTFVKNLVVGVYKFELKVTDNLGGIGRDTVQVTVGQGNQPPVAKAGADISITLTSCSETGVANLSGSASSDPDNNIVGYLWRKIAGPGSFSINSERDVSTMVQLGKGAYEFELNVTDNGGLLSKDTVKITVTSTAVPVEYDLDLTVTGNYDFFNNYLYCYYYYYQCTYYDFFQAEPVGYHSNNEQIGVSLYEFADTANASTQHNTSFTLYVHGANNKSVWGPTDIFFKQLIQKGGGAFSASFDVDGGTALECDVNIYTNRPPLSVTGTIDTTAHTISLKIKGKTFF